MSVLKQEKDFAVDNDLVEVDPDEVYIIGLGLKALFAASHPDPCGSSPHRLQCHSSTYRQLKEDIIEWALMLDTERHFRMIWLQGPEGVGKSALAKSCVEGIGPKLAAAVFFSHKNTRDDPAHIFTSVTYQLAEKYPLYRDKLGKKVYQCRSLLKESIIIQFQELIVGPLQELEKEGRGVEEGVILIDGLDQYIGEDALIDVIATSIRERTTPFVWAFFCRPESHIVARFSTPHVRPLYRKMTLPVSHEADAEIECYLRDAFENTRTRYDVPAATAWPSDSDMKDLVKRSVGSFIYPTSIIRYVGTGGPLGPKERFQQVLRHSGKVASDPWTHLDAFYTLVMEQIPKEVLPDTLKVLLAFQVVNPQYPLVVASILGFSELTFLTALRSMHSVVKPTQTDKLLYGVSFHHPSFVDFLMNSERSKNFYLRTPERCAVVFADVISFFEKEIDKVAVPWYDPGLVNEISRCLESASFDIFWRLGSYAELDEVLLQRLSKFDFQKILYGWKINRQDIERFYNNIPPGWQGKIMRPYTSLLSRGLLREKKHAGPPFILGKTDRKIMMVDVGHIHLSDYNDFKKIERHNLIWRNLIWRPLRRLAHKIGEIEKY